jgi:haloacid dehalogenase-like hydrolase
MPSQVWITSHVRATIPSDHTKVAEAVTPSIGLQVGLAVAMGNAVPEMRAVADVVVGTNDEEGVAEAIERFVLEPLGALASA